MPRRWMLAVALAATMLAAPAALAQTQGPNGVRLAYGDAPTEVTVTFTGPPGAEASVEILQPEERAVTAEPEPLPGDDEVVYRASIDGLELDKNYSYRAVIDGQAAGPFSFQTPPPADVRGPVRVTAFGDQGVPVEEPHPDRADGNSPLRNSQLVSALDPDAHLLAGDISYADGDPEIWDVYFQKNEPFWATTPFMTVPGNHEREAGQGYAQYDARLTMPEPDEIGRWWTVQVGNVQLVGLNSDTACAESQAVQVTPIISYYCRGSEADARQPNERQLSFIESTLQAAENDESVDWTIVTYHNPTYSTGSHGSNPDVQALWVPLFEEYGVDLVLNGDDHLYQRTHPLQDGTPAEEGPIYIVNGLGGSDTYEFEDEGDPPEWEAHRFNDEYGTVVIDAYQNRLETQFVTLEGKSVDRFTIGSEPNTTETEADQPANTTPARDQTENRTTNDSRGDADEQNPEDNSSDTPAPGAIVAGLAVASAALASARNRREA